MPPSPAHCTDAPRSHAQMVGSAPQAPRLVPQGPVLPETEPPPPAWHWAVAACRGWLARADMAHSSAARNALLQELAPLIPVRLPEPMPEPPMDIAEPAPEPDVPATSQAVPAQPPRPGAQQQGPRGDAIAGPESAAGHARDQRPPPSVTAQVLQQPARGTSTPAPAAVPAGAVLLPPPPPGPATCACTTREPMSWMGGLGLWDWGLLGRSDRSRLPPGGGGGP